MDLVFLLRKTPRFASGHDFSFFSGVIRKTAKCKMRQNFGGAGGERS